MLAAFLAPRTLPPFELVGKKAIDAANYDHVCLFFRKRSGVTSQPNAASGPISDQTDHNHVTNDRNARRTYYFCPLHLLSTRASPRWSFVFVFSKGATNFFFELQLPSSNGGWISNAQVGHDLLSPFKSQKKEDLETMRFGVVISVVHTHLPRAEPSRSSDTSRYNR